jgi:hypothetical protein
MLASEWLHAHYSHVPLPGTLLPLCETPSTSLAGVADQVVPGVAARDAFMGSPADIGLVHSEVYYQSTSTANRPDGAIVRYYSA